MRLLREDLVCQRLEPFFPGNGRARAAFGAEGTVDILQLGQRLCVVNGARKPVGEFFLRLDCGSDFAAPLVEIAQILQPLLQLTQRRVVHAAMLLLAVARDEGNGVALVNERDDVFNIPLRAAEFLREYFFHALHMVLLVQNPRPRTRRAAVALYHSPVL